MRENEAMRAQASRAERFRLLHARPGIFVIPNPWDAGSARILASLGLEALATTNVIMGLSGAHRALAELAALGVKRVSVGSAFARAAYGAFLRAAREVREHGTFAFADHAVPYSEINSLFKPPQAAG